MATRAAGQKTQDAYFKLVKEFPLVPIRDDTHLARAEAMMHRLLRRELGRGEQDYFNVLTDLVERYEESHMRIPDASEADVLRLLMESNGFSQSRLSREVGISQSTISSVLRGSRRLTRDQAVALGRYFHVSPAVFFSE